MKMRDFLESESFKPLIQANYNHLNNVRINAILELGPDEFRKPNLNSLYRFTILQIGKFAFLSVNSQFQGNPQTLSNECWLAPIIAVTTSF